MKILKLEKIIFIGKNYLNKLQIKFNLNSQQTQTNLRKKQQKPHKTLFKNIYLSNSLFFGGFG
ncbi:MAG: hypothetical protein ACJAVG_000807 [Rickettsiales bacterium]|jgi:hypothetical protein